MAIPGARAGRPLSIYVNGILYRSVFMAAEITGISQVWLFTLLSKNGGAPVLVKEQIITTEFWVRARIQQIEVQS